MIFKSLAVKNYGNIKSASIDLDYKGLTFIFGKNKDGGPGATNGAGKSQFWSAIPEISYGTPPTGKDGHKHKNSEIALSLQAGSNVLKFKKTYNKSGSKKFQVLKDGKDVNVRTLDYTEKKLQQYLGKTEEDFYTKVYVDSLRIHPLIVGTPAVRQDFFVRMFNLENVDNVRKLLLAELAAVQKTAATYREVMSLFAEAKKRLETTKEQRDELSENISKKQAERDDILERSNKLQKVRDLLTFESDNSKLLSKFNKLTTLENFQVDFKAARKQRNALKERAEAAQAWVAYERARSKYKEALADVKSELVELVGDDYKDQEKVTKAAKKYSTCKAELDASKSKLSDIVEQLTGLDTEKVSEPKHSEDKCRAKVSSLTEELEHSHAFKTGKCPTCGSKVDARNKDEIKEELAQWKKRLKAAVAYREYTDSADRVKSLKRKKLEVSDLVDELTVKVKKYRSYYKAKELLDDLPNDPEKPESPRESLDEVMLQADANIKHLWVFESASQVLERIESLTKLTAKDREKASKFKSLNSKLSEINAVLTDLETYRTRQEEIVSQLKTLRTRGKVLKRQADDEPILKVLVNAYSTKGLKRLLIQRYASLLEKQVNKFVRFTFSEDFTFEFKYDKRLELLVHRKYGKRVKTTDVKRLSGAEKRMFTLLLVIATYTLTPKAKRSNLLVLDEMEANMGPEAVKNFLAALPVLNKIVPHIVVITPKPELHVDGARCFTAVKSRGVTTLVKGRVQ